MKIKHLRRLLVIERRIIKSMQLHSETQITKQNPSKNVILAV